MIHHTCPDDLYHKHSRTGSESLVYRPNNALSGAYWINCFTTLLISAGSIPSPSF